MVKTIIPNNVLNKPSIDHNYYHKVNNTICPDMSTKI